LAALRLHEQAGGDGIMTARLKLGCIADDFTGATDLANNLVFRDLPGCDPEAVITNRAPSGTIVFQATDVATYNWIEAARTKTSGALQIIHGTTAGQIVQIDCPNVTLNPPTNQDSDGIWMYSFPLVLEPSSAGNDEIKITFK